MELLIAIVVLLVGIVAVAQLIPTAMNQNFRNRNDSTALISAQRQLEEMALQDLDVQNLGACAGSAPAGTYYFCDCENQIIVLERTSLNPALENETFDSGCPLNAARLINWTAACPVGFTVTKNWVWDPVSNIQQSVEIRWHVVTVFKTGTRSGASISSLPAPASPVRASRLRIYKR